MYSYPAIFTPEKGGYVIRVPDIPEVVTEGDSLEEAAANAIDAIELVLSEYTRRKWDIPRATRRRDSRARSIELPLLTQAKLSLYTALRASGVRQAELARRMGVTKAQVTRLLDLQHASRLDQVETAFRALHKRLELSVEDAA